MGALTNPKPQSFRPHGEFELAESAPSRLGDLMAPLEHLLISGSDARLAIDASTRLNVYGCAPSPRPAVISFASTTASSISSRAFAAAQRARERLAQASSAPELFDNALESLRVSLKRQFHIGDPDTEVVLAASGTDAQLCTLFIARACLDSPLTSIVVAAEETGSGTAFTALGQHFNSQTACGSAVMKGAPIEGLADGLARIDIRARDGDGLPRHPQDVDQDVIAAVTSARAQGRGVLLFAMDQSKSGLGGPSSECLRFIEEEFGANVVIALDACQGRLTQHALKRHLSRGHLVLMTGSKFFTGPPFSGAIFVPPGIAQRIGGSCEVPAGLGHYSGRSEWPHAWKQVRAQLPRYMNLGLWLRWEAALAEIAAYHRVPETFRSTALARFAAAVPRLLAEFSFCRLVDPERSMSGSAEDRAARSIYPFLIQMTGRPLSFAEMKEIYGSLNCDLSAELKQNRIWPGNGSASTLCHIGQPLLMNDFAKREVGALRLSADARFISDAWQPEDESGSIERVDAKIRDIRTILKKIEIILELKSQREVVA